MIRRITATVLGGLGIVFLCLGIISMVIIGFVSSPDAAQSTVESALANSSVREVIAKELVTKIEESADKPTEKIVFSLARPLIVNAVSEALDKPAIRDLAGEIASKAYAVFVDEEPATKVDISVFAEAAVSAIKAIDSAVAKDFAAQIDPLELKRDDNSPDIKGIRDAAQMGAWLFLVVGILLQVASWFVSTAETWLKVRCLGIRLAIGGLVLLIAVLVARQRVTSISDENREVLEVVASFVTSPILVRAWILTAVGVVTAAVGWQKGKTENNVVA